LPALASSPKTCGATGVPKRKRHRDASKIIKTWTVLWDEHDEHPERSQLFWCEQQGFDP